VQKIERHESEGKLEPLEILAQSAGCTPDEKTLLCSNAYCGERIVQREGTSNFMKKVTGKYDLVVSGNTSGDIDPKKLKIYIFSGTDFIMKTITSGRMLDLLSEEPLMEGEVAVSYLKYLAQTSLPKPS
jgi:hypothetical protein